MKDAAAAIKVGLFVIVVGIATWYTIHAVSEGLGDKKGYKVYAMFDDATGLVKKSMVQIAGLRVGEIVGRRLEGKKARIDIYLASDVVLYENAVVKKRVRSLMGGYYLEIDPGTPEMVDPVTKKVRKSRILKPGSQIPRVEEPTTTDEIMRQVGQIMPEIEKLVREVRILSETTLKDLVKHTDEAIVSNRAALLRLINRLDSIAVDIKKISARAPQDFNAIVSDIREMVAELNNIVKSTGGDLKYAGKSVRESMDKINRILDRVDKQLTPEEGDVGAILSDTRGIAKNIKEITEKINKGEGTIGQFVTDDSIAKDIKAITRDAKSFLGGLTRLETVVGLRSEYNLIANTVKTYVSVAVYPRQDKYYLVEFVDDPRGLMSTVYTIRTTDDPDEPELTRTKEITVTDTYRLTFMFAKKVDFLTFRFGIKESTGGLGLDFNFLDDRLKIQTDLFDFSSNVFPRVKLGMLWEFYSRMFLVAGVDDLLNERPRTGAGGGRDFFIGAQIRFTDEDLKGLLMIGGSSMGSSSSNRGN